jgi:Fe2+ or Zn2+ uptake regulation protein
MPNAADRDHELLEALRARGQRATTQRIVLHRTLRELNRHVTADELLEATGERLPGVSLPTVYATLETFEQLGLVRRVPVTGGPTLYEPRTEPHHHLVCQRCGAVEDLEAAVDVEPALRAARGRGWVPSSDGIVMSGLCGACARG